jgi:hypothetical protein
VEKFRSDKRTKGGKLEMGFWRNAATHVGGGVDNLQCQNRYRNKLDPALQKLTNGPWTEAEVLIPPPPTTPLLPPLYPPLTPSNLLPLLCTLSPISRSC